MRIPGVLAILSFFFCLHHTAPTVSAQPVMQARIHIADEVQMREVLELNLDIAYVKPGEYIDIVTDREEVGRLRSWGYDVEVVHEDMVAFYQSRLDPTKDMGGYHTYAEVGAALDSMHTLYPLITSDTINIGLSLEGRSIWAFKISDNPDVDEDEPEVFYNSLIHAREPISMEVLLYFMWHLLDNYGTDSLSTYLVDNRELWFVSVVNPDGYEYNRETNPGGGGMWRKNRRNCGGGDWGVDLNRNWGYMWGYDNIGSSPFCSNQFYRGAAPFSEPETQALRDFINNRNFVMCLDNHAHGMWLIYPWGYDRLYTPHHDLFVAIAETMAVFNGHTPGTSWETLNYLTNGCSKDWEYGDTISKPMILGMVTEIGTEYDGFWPPSSRILPLCQLELPANLLYAELADDPNKIFPPNSPVLATIDIVGSDYTVAWSFNDTLNPASAFELAEMNRSERIVYDVEGEYDYWDLDGFSISTNRYFSPTHSFYSEQGNNLDNNATTVDSIDVRPGDAVRILCWYEIEADRDYAYVEISTDGGNDFFSLPGNITTDYNPHGSNLGNGITGSSGGWIVGEFDIDAYVGREVYIRLRYVTGPMFNEEGFYADDIFPFQRYHTLSDAIEETFYQIWGQEEGTYFYRVRAKDEQSQWSGWSDVEKAVVIPGFVRGDANGDCVINVADVVYLVNFLYRGGDPPVPMEAGDANYDQIVNVGDVIFLVNYLYRGGDPPGC